MRPVEFIGNALEELRAFPEGARREAGFQIDLLQRGLDPDDWKPMKTVGTGVREIRVRETSGAYRIIYFAMLADAVFVLRAFRKKTRATSQHDIDIARARFRELMRRLQK